MLNADVSQSQNNDGNTNESKGSLIELWSFCLSKLII